MSESQAEPPVAASHLTLEVVAKQLAQLEEMLVELREAGHIREYLLARLCLGGMRLKEAAKTTIGQLLTPSKESELEVSLPRYRCTDHYFSKLPPLCLDCYRHCVGFRDRRDQSKTTSFGMDAAFPSRKKGLPITTRSAERSLFAACCEIGEIRQYAFRQIQKIGRLARLYNDEFLRLSDDLRLKNKLKSREGMERLQSICDAVRPYLQKRLKNPAVVEETIQEVAMRFNNLREQSNHSTSLNDDIKFAFGIAKNVMLEALRVKDAHMVTISNGFFWSSLEKGDSDSRSYYETENAGAAKRVIAEILACLSENELVVIQKRYLEKRLTHNVIANLIGKRAKSVQRIEVRALKKLRKEMGRRSSQGINFMLNT